MVLKYSFRGLMAPVFTPFTPDGKDIKLDVIPEYARHLERSGIHAVLVNGTSGEGPSLTVKERIATVDAWVKTGLIVLAQVGGASLSQAQEMARECEALGVSGLLTLPELYWKPNSASEAARCMGLVASSAPDTPILYYHIPAWTGISLDSAEITAEAVSQVPNFAGIKFTHSDLDMAARTAEVHPDVAVFIGNDMIMAGACAMGLESAIGTTLNMLASETLDIVAASNEGRPKEALAAQVKLNRAVAAITKSGAGWVPTMKAAMSILTGIDVGPPRDPIQPLSREAIMDMKRNLCKE